MKPIAPGTVIFHRYRGYGVLTAVNLLTGWVSARFGNEQRCLDLNLSTDEVQHADGEPILFRLSPPDRMPHGRLMEMVLKLHTAGYQRLYLYSWPKDPECTGDGICLPVAGHGCKGPGERAGTVQVQTIYSIL